MLDTPWSEVVWRLLATYSIRQFPLHFPSRASPCVITFQLDSKYISSVLFALASICVYCKQDRQCTYDVSVWHVRATIVAVEKQWVLHNHNVCICNLRYPACNAHVPCCHMWPVPLYNIFPHYLINGTIFGGGDYWTHDVCFDLSETFLILRRNERNVIK